MSAPTIAPLPAEFVAQLAQRLPADRYTTDPAELMEYDRDWTRIYAPAPSLVVLPRGVEEVAQLLALCDAHRVAVVPSRAGARGWPAAPWPVTARWC